MYMIDDAVKALIEGGVAVEVATADARGRAHQLPGWGPRVCDGGRLLHVFFENPRSNRALANIAETGRLAVVFADPVSYRSVQIKGHAAAPVPATEEEIQWVERHRNAFLTSVALIGDPPSILRNLWMHGGFTRVALTVEQGYDQTPGPNAGVPL